MIKSLLLIHTYLALTGIISYTSAQTVYPMHIIQPGSLETPSICMVSIDPETEKNVITWKETSDLHINKYQVWKAANVYSLLVSESSGNEPNIITDWKSQPENNAYHYSLVSIDTCGNASLRSLSHKPFLLNSAAGLNDAVNLTWKQYYVAGSEYFFNSIVIFRGTDLANLIPIDTIDGSNGTYNDENPPLHQDLFYRIAGVNDVPCKPGPHALSLSNLGYISRNFTSGNLTISRKLIEIYPNPMKMEAKIAWNNSKNEPYILFIYDLKGILLKKIPNLYTNEYHLSRENLKSGYYLIELQGSNKFHGRLFII